MGSGFLGIGLVVLIFFYMWNRLILLPHIKACFILLLPICASLKILNLTLLVNTSEERIEETYKWVAGNYAS